MTVVSELRDYPFEPFTGDLPAELLDMVVSDPVSRVRLPDGRPAWLVLGYQDCCTVLADPRFSRLPPGATATPDGVGPRELNMDGPAHAVVRRVASRAFTARRIDTFRPRVRRLVDALLDDLLAGPRPADLVAALVAPLPVYVVCDVLGVPVADRPRFYGWIEGLNSVTAYGSADAATAQAQLRDYLAGQLADKRVSPGDDLLSAWVLGRDAHELVDAELVELAMGVLLGGLEINSTSAGLRALFQHPEQLAKLRADPGKLSSATDEILRYTSVSSMFRVQVVQEDLTLGGVAMRAGDCVMAIPWAGNRDPRVFPDPNVFDIDRVPTAPHLTFGFGPHFCLGTALGRMQVELSIGELLRRLPGLTPAVPIEQIPWRHDRMNGGIASFPVTW
ncbi:MULTISPECIES: cytochrome P450 [Micromonospora]|uniref:Cytochrome P450 n=1 Tax=Micromonospora antibiotica TaxID=2807623 RepID=A0ABS3VD46_9ACTN|nr:MULTISPECIES: cytochrome P450 [Micromonospora]MBO4163536.1 cytochrome P450 [Micromonospora antibiotica]MBW4705776.1 cytochrome P450 [Micromonospora sp. RL09-050-HVF-A]